MGVPRAILLFFLYFLIFSCGLSIARFTREPYGRLVAVGVVVTWAVQVFINVGMTVQLMPVTGLPLPFMSYGGSSLLSSFIALGSSSTSAADASPSSPTRISSDPLSLRERVRVR